MVTLPVTDNKGIQWHRTGAGGMDTLIAQYDCKGVDSLAAQSQSLQSCECGSTSSLVTMVVWPTMSSGFARAKWGTSAGPVLATARCSSVSFADVSEARCPVMHLHVRPTFIQLNGGGLKVVERARATSNLWTSRQRRGTSVLALARWPGHRAQSRRCHWLDERLCTDRNTDRKEAIATS